MKMKVNSVLLMTVIVVGCVSGHRLTMDEVKRELSNLYPEVRTISVQDAHEMLLSGRQVVLLDVREPEEYAISHLKGAVRARTIGEAVPILTPDDVPIIVYCSVGYRSSELAVALMGQGYTNVLNLEGAIFEWSHAALPLYREDQLVREVHPFDETWGRLLDPRRVRPSEKPAPSE
jgi:rhodanese-related sulfurtransferase